MRFYILSDLHLEIHNFIPPKVEADVVILAGDICTGDEGVKWAQRTFPDLPVTYVMGNHEHYHSEMLSNIKEIKDCAKNSNVTVLENDAIELDECVILGCTLWTDFNLFGDRARASHVAVSCMHDFRIVAYGNDLHILTPEDTMVIHHESRIWLAQQAKIRRDKPLIVVTHHGPSMQSVHPKFIADDLTPAFSSDIEKLVKELSPALWVHGHTHEAMDYQLERTRVICNPKGYPGEKNEFKRDLVIEI